MKARGILHNRDCINTYGLLRLPLTGDYLAYVEPQDEGQGDPAQQGLYQHHGLLRLPPPGDDLAHVEPQDEGQGDPAQRGLHHHLRITKVTTTWR
jgi:hypothetical protein